MSNEESPFTKRQKHTYPAEFVGIVFVVDQHGYSQFPPLSPCALTQ